MSTRAHPHSVPPPSLPPSCCYVFIHWLCRSDADKWHFWGGMFVKHVLWSRIGRLVTVGTLWALLWRTLWARDTERSDGEKWGEERVGVGAGAGWKTAAGLNDCLMGMEEKYWRRMSAAVFSHLSAGYRSPLIEKFGRGASDQKAISHPLWRRSASDFTERPRGDLRGYQFPLNYSLCVSHLTLKWSLIILHLSESYPHTRTHAHTHLTHMCTHSHKGTAGAGRA